ncbi:hypothetical protein CBW65_04905 [Tumebacillus avium]|uniref:Pyrrolo-quinoline quinone repeat domain-containing protein n=1 Tax=Tumebacillus avium TaxID=1903704 RepID=A0A1Y0ILS7_9BACL|nr:PQQ-binding-like beta-propeller repeat protein [Tumebacillus avium]ARU60485.1 hypothetical protein CBW65_04905 [Tumebacillus avium]
MSYTPKTNWQYDEVLSEKDMNRIEGGIGASQEQLDAHLADRNNPHGVTADQIGAETPSGAQAKVDAHANATTTAHMASAIALDDAGNNFTATDLEGAMVELFGSVSNGKSLVATAITGKGGTVAGTAPYSFQQLTDGVNSIKTGYAPGENIPLTALGSKVLMDKRFDIPGLHHVRMMNEDRIHTINGTNLYSVDQNGNLLWSNAYVSSDVVDFDVDAVTGDTWVANSPNSIKHFTNTGVLQTGYYMSSVTAIRAHNSIQYWGGTDGFIRKTGPTPSNAIWSFNDASQPIRSVDIDAQESVYYSFNNTAAGNVKKRDKNGALIWSSEAISSPLVHVNRPTGNVYLQTTNKNLVRLNSATGVTMWIKPINDAVLVGSDNTGNVFVHSPTAGLSKYDPNGNLVWTEPNLRIPHNVAKRTVFGDNIYLFNGANNTVQLMRLRQSLVVS